MDLKGTRVAVLVEQKYEELEVWYPVYRLREAGCEVVLVGPKAGETYPSKLGYPAKADVSAADVTADRFHAVVIPGGFSPDYVRRSEPMLKLWTGYKMSDTLSVELTVGQVQGLFSGTDFWHLNLLSEPWSDRRLSPFFGVGVGKFKNIPSQTLVGALTTNANLANAVIGARYHLSDRFMLQVDPRDARVLQRRH